MRHTTAKLYNKIFGLMIFNKQNISMHEEVKLFCRLSIKGPGSVKLGKGCEIRAIPGARIKMVTLYTHSPDAMIQIGDNVHLVAARISSRFNIQIGHNVIIEDASILDTDFHTLDRSRRTPADETMEGCRVIIEDDVMIGSRAIIAKGVTLGKGAIVYPGSVVQKSFPEYSVILGNPARRIGQREI